MLLAPTTAPRAALGCIGFMNAAFGVRFAPLFFAPRLALFLAPPFFAPPFLAPFFAPPFLAPFFFAAILSPGRWNGNRLRTFSKSTRFPYENTLLSEGNSTTLAMERKRKFAIPPMRIDAAAHESAAFLA